MELQDQSCIRRCWKGGAHDVLAIDAISNGYTDITALSRIETIDTLKLCQTSTILLLLTHDHPYC